MKPDAHSRNKAVDVTHERFSELGRKLLSVKKADIDALEKEWKSHRSKAVVRKRK